MAEKKFNGRPVCTDVGVLFNARVFVPRFTLVRSMHPQDPDSWFRSQRGVTVEIQPQPWGNDEVTWAGKAGYWKRASVDDVVFVIDTTDEEEAVKRWQEYKAQKQQSLVS